MEVVVGVLIVAALTGAVLWNHRNRKVAMAGVEFSVPESPDRVVSAIAAAYCHGAMATAKSLLLRVKVYPSGGSGFRFETKLGDIGRIEVRRAPESGSVVRARTDELYVGSHPSTHFRNGNWIMGLSATIVHGLFKLLGVTPYAVKMNRFQRGLERRISRQLRPRVGA